jgi:O-antigen ligase
MNSALALQPESAPAADARPAITSSWLLYGACAILMAGPLAFGAVEPWGIFGLQASATLLFLAWAFRQWKNRELQVIAHPLYAPMLAFAALVALQWITGMTAYRHVTYAHMLLYFSYGMLVFVITQTLRRTSQLDKLAWVLGGYGALVATSALIQGLVPSGKLYGIWKPERGGWVYGPYVNHNHYAGLMEMLAPFLLVLAATRFTRGNRKLVVGGIAALMAGTIFLSGSRAGMLALTLQAVLLVVLLRPRQENWKQHVILGICLALAIGFLVWVGGNEFTQRLASIQSETQQELSGGTRINIDRDCFRMWWARPILGWGLGTFPTAYPQFRSFYTTFFVNEAHNDYLQLLAETGLIGFGIAVWFLMITFRRAWAKLDNWTESVNGSLTVAALLGCIGILVHSFFDFNLQIPANAALFYVLCAIAAADPLQESQRRRVRRRLQAEEQAVAGNTL